MAALLDLGRLARGARSNAELQFIVVNNTHAIAPYRQAALWSAEQGVAALSGVVEIEANAPYVHWLNQVCQALAGMGASPSRIGSQDLPEQEGSEWAEWLPTYGLWLPLQAGERGVPGVGGVLLARDTPWLDREIFVLAEWTSIWRHARRSLFHPNPWSLKRLCSKVIEYARPEEGERWWKQRRTRLAAFILVLLFFPVRLTVLAPGELVPANPAVIRAPLDGVIDTFAVRPNAEVKKGQHLFNFDETPLLSRLEVAGQALATAEAEYRQTAQLAVSDTKSKAQLATLSGKIEERKAEAEYFRGLLERAHVTSPQDGIAIFDDPTEWIGKPVQTGERIMRIAAPNDAEVEAWLAVADAIPLEMDAPVSLYLNASPLFPVSASVRYMAHEAVLRPDGSYAYRVRAKVLGQAGHRVGSKGTAKLNGGWVPLCYWILRRPVAGLRQTIGW